MPLHFFGVQSVRIGLPYLLVGYHFVVFILLFLFSVYISGTLFLMLQARKRLAA